MNASPCREIEKMMNKHADRKKRHIEFIEGLSTYLADGFLGCQLSMEPWKFDPKSVNHLVSQHMNKLAVGSGNWQDHAAF